MQHEGPTHRLAFFTPEGGIGYQDVSRGNIATPIDADEAARLLAESIGRPGLHVFAWSRFEDVSDT